MPFVVVERDVVVLVVEVQKLDEHVDVGRMEHQHSYVEIVDVVVVGTEGEVVLVLEVVVDHFEHAYSEDWNFLEEQKIHPEGRKAERTAAAVALGSDIFYYSSSLIPNRCDEGR
jgi:hypothetical protein